MSRFLRASGLGLCLAAPAWGQSPADLQRQAREAIAIAGQKAEDDVTRALADAEKLSATSRPEAAEYLKRTLLGLEGRHLSDLHRQTLAARLKKQIIALEGRATIINPPEEASKANAAARAAIEKATIESNEVTKGLRKAEELVNDNRTTEAALTIDRLRAKYPNNPALLALTGTSLTRNNLATWNQLQDKFAAAWLADQQDMLRTATPIAGNIEFPSKKEWDRLTELRRSAMMIKISDKEKAILESLNTVVTVIIKDRPFQEALQEFSNQIKQEIHLDTKSLEDAGLDLNRRTNFTGAVSARTALRALLQSQGLTYVVKDEMIQVVSLEKAEREMLTTRTYVISDLVDVGGPFSNAVRFGPVASYQQMQQNAEEITRLIKESIDPRCWKDKGGFCTITFHLPTKSLVVRASTEVHASLGGAMYGKK